jgi:hypothetical protein
MQTTAAHDTRIATMTFSAVYPMYVQKVVRKGRTEKELLQVITWLTGYTEKEIKVLIKEQVTFKEFFKGAKLHKNAKLITGTICGYKIEEIKTPLTRKVRYLDKLVDELAKGKAMEKVLREG